jgi:hypothetical protein
MAGHSATMLSTSSSPFTQMGRWQEIASDRTAICSTISRTSGRHTKSDAPPLSARRESDRGPSALAGAIFPEFFVSSFVSTTVQPHAFSIVSGVSAHLKKHAKQAENEKNDHRRDLTRMVS